MVCGHGVNDMRKGWTKENEWNKMVYEKWRAMLKRCYSEKLHDKRPTYKECKVCNKWLKLSGFVEDFKSIDGYDEQLFLVGKLVLDKDIKSDGKIKEYSLENCMLVSGTENTIQANKTKRMKIKQYDNNENLIKIWNSSREIQRELGISHGNISQCCKFWEINCNKEEWYKIHKNRPIKSAGGFIWRYYKEEE